MSHTEPEDPEEPRESPPLGATAEGRGTTFRVFSQHATAMYLSLFDRADAAEAQRVPMERGRENIWQVALEGVGPGQLYGFRAAGPWAPESGFRFNPAKLLFDPYARAYRGEVRFHSSLDDHRPTSKRGSQDSAAYVPKAEVVATAFDWAEDRPPAIPWQDTVIYEAHTKGLTALAEDLSPGQRGTFAALGHPAVLEHLTALGVTSIELLPIFYRVSERRLETLRRTNYWGYNTLGFFAPDRRFCATEDPAKELKTAIRALHDAGLEVLLDVVYNHTAEGDENGPVLSFKGLDNHSYYRLDGPGGGAYENLSGCGNTLDIRHPRVLALVLDSLRYWVEEFHVDGFRFDLAPTLGRLALTAESPFDPRAPFFQTLATDPLLSRVKWIAEPWDLGAGGYNLGRFPQGWSQWNDRYRDTVRSFWRGDAGRLGQFAARLTGSQDLFSSPAQSLNFVTAHDGFTLRDLVSYERRHNQANGEDGRDGHRHNLSRDWGEESQRAKAQRNFLATLAFSRGIPMLSHGDELGRSQQGNNNAYCHDSPLTWIHWPPDSAGRQLLRFTRQVFHLRRKHPLLRRTAFFETDPSPRGDHLRWILPEGREPTAEDWEDPRTQAMGALFLPADPAQENPLLLLINGSEAPTAFLLPRPPDDLWRILLDTAAYPEIPAVDSALEPSSLRMLGCGS